MVQKPESVTKKHLKFITDLKLKFYSHDTFNSRTLLFKMKKLLKNFAFKTNIWSVNEFSEKQKTPVCPSNKGTGW